MRRVCREANHRHTSAWVYPLLAVRPICQTLDDAESMQQHMRPAFPKRAAITLLLAQPSLEKPAKSLNRQILQQEHVTALTTTECQDQS